MLNFTVVGFFFVYDFSSNLCCILLYTLQCFFGFQLNSDIRQRIVNNRSGYSLSSKLFPVWFGSGRAAVKALRCFWSARQATALEAVCSLCFMVVMVGGVFEVVNTFFVSDLLDRAAHAVARDNSLQKQAAATEEQLLERALAAIRAELGDGVDPDLLRIDIDVYDNPSTMLRGELSAGESGLLGGDAGDMVVVRLGFTPGTLIGWMQKTLLSEDVAFRTLAVIRNERTVGLP